MLDKLRKIGFDVGCYHHADALLSGAFPGAVEEIEDTLAAFRLPMSSLIGSGGGETEGTQRLRRELSGRGWVKRTIQVEKTVVTFEGTAGKRSYTELDRATVASLSHEIDHVKSFEAGTILLEIEWNNKDPFFDRDLENFKRLHADGAANIGVLITRGQSFEDNITAFVKRYAENHDITSLAALMDHGLEPTRRQQNDITKAVARAGDFATGWAAAFVSDKYASSTTNWAKLEDRMRRGVGNPCPLVAIGIPSTVIIED
ncbi:BglII/BstYI family type II restriction endonuclease [Maricaulis sp.]|uniref:BglII/BstYI family type II restriction endonuclease n=1 Tax=Maricaulis sp. TaxID=1486257 RepID=UPI003A906FB2